ncbi:MAG TPA: lipocalin-like domain-containing protein [Pyrinomonadaceae bacterium]|nr:lipocalin-like domain-containing protein [Pyrinomonadaceae bacterium]
MTAVTALEIETQHKFIGTWKLTDAEGEGPLMQRLGDNPIGMLIYDGHGHMAVQMMNKDRAKLPLTSDGDFEFALRGYMGYFGSYELNLDEKIVSHHIVGSIQPGDVGLEFRRRYEFVDDQLILTTLGSIGGEELAARLVWERWRD